MLRHFASFLAQRQGKCVVVRMKLVNASRNRAYSAQSDRWRIPPDGLSNAAKIALRFEFDSRGTVTVDARFFRGLARAKDREVAISEIW